MLATDVSLQVASAVVVLAHPDPQRLGGAMAEVVLAGIGAQVRTFGDGVIHVEGQAERVEVTNADASSPLVGLPLLRFSTAPTLLVVHDPAGRMEVQVGVGSVAALGRCRETNG